MSAENRGHAQLALALILVLGAAARVVGLAENPVGLFVDETSVAVNARLIAEAGIDQYGERWPLFFRALDDYKEPLFVYSVAAWIGRGDVSAFDLRLPAALWGVLGLWVAARLGRAVTGREAGGAWTALFLAVTPWHIVYSRWAEQAVVLTVTHSAAALALVRLWRQPSRPRAVLAAVLLAAAPYAYSPGRLLAPVTALAVLAAACWTKRLSTPVVVSFCLALVAALAPFAAFSFDHGAAMNLRFVGLALSAGELPGAWISHLTPAFLFGPEGDGNLRHAPGTGLLPLTLLPLVAIGAWSGRRSGVVRTVAGFALLATTLGAFTDEYPHASRVLPMLPFVQVLAAVGLLAVLDRLGERRAALARLAVLSLLALEFTRFWAHYWTAYPVDSRFAWREGLLPALAAAGRLAQPGERVFAPTALAVDWMFVHPPRPADVLAARPFLAANEDRHDPADEAGKHQRLYPDTWFGPAADAARADPAHGGAGLWVLPRFRLPAAALASCLHLGPTMCVIRVGAWSPLVR